jgi:hypothetical protein
MQWRAKIERCLLRCGKRAHLKHDLKVLLRSACAALLVDDVSASKHDLHSDNDRNVLAHSRSR